MKWDDKYANLVRRTVHLDGSDIMDLLRKRDMVPLNMVMKGMEFDERRNELVVELEQETPKAKP